jgi:hypothetical protein
MLPTPTPVTSFPVGVPAGQQPSVFVFDSTNGFPLYLLNPDSQNNWPASTVKMMTFILMRQFHSADWTSGTVTVTNADVTQPYSGVTLSGPAFAVGDVVTWEGLAYAGALASAFDAMAAAARVIGSDGAGTGGLAGFVTLMNTKASSLGLTNTTFFDPYGGSETFSPDVVRNIMSARDLATLTKQCMADPVLRDIAVTATKGIAVTGGSPRTVTVNHDDALVNGPLVSPAGFKDPRFLGGKIGGWAIGSTKQYSQGGVWTSPAGYEVVIAVLGSIANQARILDVTGIVGMMLRDFPYLAVGIAASDPSWNNVTMLVGGNGSITDESQVGRALTVTGVTPTGPAVVGGSSASMSYTAVANVVSAADAADLEPGSGNYTDDLQWAGVGEPAGGVENVWIFKSGGATNKECAFNWIGGVITLFASSDGSNWVQASATYDADSRAVLWNGAPRHLAVCKNGSTHTLYIAGQQITTVSVGTVFDGTAALQIGCGSFTLSALGNYAEYRRTVGTARYTTGVIGVDGYRFPRQ